MNRENNNSTIGALGIFSFIFSLILNRIPFFMAQSNVVEFAYTEDLAWILVIILTISMTVVFVIWIDRWMYRKSFRFMLYHSEVGFKNSWTCIEELFKYLDESPLKRGFDLGKRYQKIEDCFYKGQYEVVLEYLRDAHNANKLTPEEAFLMRRLIAIYEEKPDFSVPLFPSEKQIQTAAEYYVGIPEKINILLQDIRKARKEMKKVLNVESSTDNPST